MAVEIEDRDLGWRAIADAVQALDGRSVLVGSTGPEAAAPYVDPESGRENDFHVALLLSWHEFGIGVPERSVVRAWADERPREFKDRTLVAPFAKALDSAGDGVGELEGVGETLSKSMRTRLEAGISPGLSSATIANRDRPSELARDGRELPLLDSLQILGSLTFRVD